MTKGARSSDQGATYHTNGGIERVEMLLVNKDSGLPDFDPCLNSNGEGPSDQDERARYMTVMNNRQRASTAATHTRLPRRQLLATSALKAQQKQRLEKRGKSPLDDYLVGKTFTRPAVQKNLTSKFKRHASTS